MYTNGLGGKELRVPEKSKILFVFLLCSGAYIVISDDRVSNTHTPVAITLHLHAWVNNNLITQIKKKNKQANMHRGIREKMMRTRRKNKTEMIINQDSIEYENNTTTIMYNRSEF